MCAIFIDLKKKKTIFLANNPSFWFVTHPFCAYITHVPANKKEAEMTTQSSCQLIIFCNGVISRYSTESL